MKSTAFLSSLGVMLALFSFEARGQEDQSLPRIIRSLKDNRPNKEFPLAPDFKGIAEWIGSEPLKIRDLRKKVVILHFWTNGCINCRRNYEHYRQWLKDFDGKDVVMVGVHTPELEWEKDVARIRSEVEKNGLSFPVAVDTEGETWRAWDNRIWPTVYVIDQKGRVRYVWVGELAWEGAKGAETVADFVRSLLDGK
jgi:peroxiredoxin